MDTAIDFKIAVISSPRGFQEFIRDAYFNIVENPFYNILFVQISDSRQLRGCQVNSVIVHYSSRDINPSDYQEILKHIPARCIKIK